MAGMDITWCSPDRSEALAGTAMQQHPTYARALAGFGRQSIVAEFHEDGARVGRAQIVLRQLGPVRVAWLARGPVWQGAPRRDALGLMHRTAPWRALWATAPDAAAPRGLRISAAPLMAEIDLRPDEATRRAALCGKWRNRLCRAEEAGLRILARPCHLPRDNALLMREVQQRKARGYAGLPAAFTAAWIAADPGGSLVVEARQGGQTLAFMLFLRHGDRATYHSGWTGALGRMVHAHQLILWSATNALAEMGCTALDLGRIDTAPPGLAHFKRGAGARTHSLAALHLSL